MLQKLRKNKLYLKHKKCTFEQEEVEYLELLVSQGKVQMDPVKTGAVAEWPVPKVKWEVQQFLGFVNFYRRFIQGFAVISKPLTELTGKSEWKWGSKQQGVFDQIKEAITTAPVLAIPNDEGKYRVEADASDFATKGILSQQIGRASCRERVFVGV